MMGPFHHGERLVASFPFMFGVACFLIGRFLQPISIHRGPHNGEGTQKSEVRAVHTTRMAMEPQHEDQLGRLQGVLPGTEELPDPGKLEQALLHQSQLLAHRPPMKPAASGDESYTLIPYQILSWWPRLVLFPNFIDRKRCEHIIALAKQHMEPSGLAYKPGEQPDPQQDTRTSSGTFLMTEMDPDGVLGWLEERIATATLIPAEHGEAFNVLHYVNGQHYDSHMDSFDEREFGPQESQRMATMLVYLSDVEEGGETIFKREGKEAAGKPITSYKDCNADGGYRYKPRLGDAVLFYSLTLDGKIDDRALHGGCPVIRGEKWVVTKWMRNKVQRKRSAS